MKKTFLSSAIVSVLMVASAVGMYSSLDINGVADELFYENQSTYNNAASQVFSDALSVEKLSENDIYSESGFNLVRNAIQANIVSKYKKYSSDMDNVLKDFVFTNRGRAWKGVVRGRFDNTKKKIIEFLMRDMAYSDAQTKIELDKKRQTGESSIDIVESIGLLFDGGIEVADIDPETSSNLLKISEGSSFAHGSQSLNNLPEDQRTPDMFLAIRSEIISAFKGKKRDELIGKEGGWEPVYRLLDEAVKSAKKKIGEGAKYTEKNIHYISNDELSSNSFSHKSGIIYIVGSEGIKSSTENPPFDSQSSPEIKNEEQEKVKAEADERAQKAEKLKLYKEEKTKAVQGLLNGQELADLQRVAETLSKLPVPTHSTEHSPSVDSSVLEPYEAFKAIETRFQEFKTKLGELKTNFENLTELADASEKPADSFEPVVLTSGDLEQALVEAQRQLTYEEGTLSYNIAKAEYELFRDKQLNLNTRIVAKKCLKQLASEATSVSSDSKQLDDYFHGEKSSTQKFQEQFRALGSTLESVADSVETEFSEEKEKLQEDFENSLYYRYILKKSEEKKSEEKEITTKSEEKTASKPKILLENLVFQPFGSLIGMQLSSEYLDSEDMIKDSNIQYLDDNQEDSENEVSEVSLRHLFAVNLLVQRLQTTSPTLGTSEKGDSSTKNGTYAKAPGTLGTSEKGDSSTSSWRCSTF